MKTNKLLQGLILLCLLVVGVSNLCAQQLLDATITETIELWQPFRDGNYIGRGDDPYIGLPMPFNFTFDGVSVKTLHVYGDGFISINNYLDPFPQNIPAVGVRPLIISWYAQDLRTDSSLSWKLTGEAPFRVLTIQQLGARTQSAIGVNFGAQIKFYETSNQVKIIYGNTDGLGQNGKGVLYFSGSSASKYINIKPNRPELPSTMYRSNVNPNTTAWLTTDAPNLVPKGKTYTMSNFPSLARINPDYKKVLAIGTVYDNTQDRPFVVISRAAGQPEVNVKYSIKGPLHLPDAQQQVIYTGVESTTDITDESIYLTPQPLGNLVRCEIPHAKGIAGRLSDGALDLATNASQIVGGEYEITATIEYIGSAMAPQVIKARTNIALPNDIAISSILQPVTPEIASYSMADRKVPLQITVTNVGKNSITKFEAVANVYDENNNPVGSSPYKLTWEDNQNPILKGETRDITVDYFVPTAIGQYRVEYNLNLLNVIKDDNLANNVMPRSGDPQSKFKVVYETEITPYSIEKPASTKNYVYKPIRPVVIINNNGVSDISDVPCKITISRNGNVMFYQELTIDAVPAGVIRQKRLVLDTTYTPTEAGDYSITVEVKAPRDENTANDVLTQSFTVSKGLSGTYSVNQDLTSSSTNFSSLQEAITELYRQGVSGPVVFELKNPEYNIGDPLSGAAAIDLTTAVSGVDDQNTVTFKAGDNMNTRGAVTINLNSGNGIGVLFGQASSNANLDATVNLVKDSYKKNYANSNGYIIFDGGTLKVIKMKLHATGGFRSVMYLGQGTSNITLKNLLIEDDSPVYNTYLPSANYNPGGVCKFNFESNTNISAGIMCRNILPLDTKTQNNQYNLDTLNSRNNLITANEVYGFGYGIVSLGIGYFQDAATTAIVRSYNSNNVISHNKISDVRAAGIFVGFEENSAVKNNRIFDVNGASLTECAAIMAGGVGTSNLFGYTNINLSIDGNEVSGISGASILHGIKVEASSVNINADGKDYIFPEKEESVKVINNIVWGLNAVDNNTYIYGIRVGTRRANMFAPAFTTPKVNDYFSRNDLVANNTIIIDDAGEESVANAYALSAIAASQANGLRIYNNAISMTDQSIDPNNDYAAAIFYYGLTPKTANFRSDRNIYWLSEANVDMARVVETDANSQVINPGYAKEIKDLSQWRFISGSEGNSVENTKFIKELVYSTSIPPSVRIAKNPYPFGSVLNNRGENISEIKTDIDGNLRGQAGQRYDIGACEFDGRLFISDIEVLNFSAPYAYKATDGKYADAEYIMTTSPVPVSVRLRNNGSIRQSGVTVTVKVFKEKEDGSFDETVTPEFENSIIANDIPAGETVEFTLTSPKMIFEPKTYERFKYADNKGYTNIPSNLVSMINNVTPRYKFVLSTSADELNANNYVSKVCRFYIKKSILGMIFSSEYIQSIDPANLPSDPNVLAANLNLDSLKEYFFDLGWKNDVMVEDPKISYDLFDRKGWEPRGTDYTIYRTMFWLDGHDIRKNETTGVDENNVLTSYDQKHIKAYLESGDLAKSVKKNFFTSSQDFVRNNDSTFIATYFKADAADPSNPLGDGVDYSGNSLKGIIVGRNLLYKVIPTTLETLHAAQYPANYPQPGLMYLLSGGTGIGRMGMIYTNVAFNPKKYKNVDSVPANLKIACIPTTTLKYNAVNLGVEWRHWEKGDQVLRAILDFAETNDGNVVPVELLDMTAAQAGNRVDINWSTASEINSARFEVEKAQLTNAGRTSFEKIDEMSAAGNSNSIRYYGPVVDKNVEYGNTYAYRLKMIDRDGDYSYSDEKVVEMNGSNGNINLGEIYPNPVSTVSNFEFTLSAEMNVEISLFDINGKQVATLANSRMNAGTHDIAIEADALTSGVYTIIVKAGDVVLTKTINVVK